MIKKTHKQKIAVRQIAEPYIVNPSKMRDLGRAADPFNWLMGLVGFEPPPTRGARADYGRLMAINACATRP